MSYFRLSPHVPTANTCQDCDKHLRVVHSATPRCDRCLPDDVSELKTCACHLARYCDARCQKNNWEAHRARCQNATQVLRLSRMLGPAAEARHLSFVDWCKHSDKQFAPSALWALGAGTDADRTGTHLFVIYIEVEETISTAGKTRFKRRVRTAKCGRSHLPCLSARILLVDDGLPNVVNMFDHIAEGVDIVKIRSQFAMAAASALNIPRYPQRIVTHSLVLYIDVEERQGVFGKHTVRSAKMMSLAELRPLFHDDAYIIKAKLFPQPNILRTVIVDDSLPFGRDIQVLAIDMSKSPNPRSLYPYHSDWLTRLKSIVEQ
ncbi:hypothetical protein C8R44DRAFT_991879 [Mycena epipterygia]|nr:hypothetical protein C8R44DRAFT_991879 [Mycena epipterygia]